MKDKKNILVGILVLLVVVLLALWIITLRNNNNKVNINGNTVYYCDRKYSEENDTLNNIIYRQTVNVDETGEVTNTFDNVVYTFKNKEAFKSAKDWESENTNKDSYNYNYDESNLTLTLESKTGNQIKDEKGNVLSVWYKEYLKSFEQNGYTCTKK